MTYLHLSIHFFLSLTSVGNLNKLHACFPPERCLQPIAKQYIIEQECYYQRLCSRELEKESESRWDLQTLLSGLKFCQSCLLGPVPITYESVVGELKKGPGRVPVRYVLKYRLSVHKKVSYEKTRCLFSRKYFFLNPNC